MRYIRWHPYAGDVSSTDSNLPKRQLIHMPSHSTAVDAEQDNPVEVPTLHVLFARLLPHSLVSRPFAMAPTAESEHTRSELIDWIAEESLGGDKHAAEWLLLAIVGRV
jgi:hypothetical protein